MIEYMDIVWNVAISFAIAVVLGYIIIPMLRRLKVGQSIREEGPKSHFNKSGTPTMGGIIIFISLVITLLISGIIDRDTYVLLFATLGFSLIGFIDDYIIVVRENNRGLRAYQKLIGQITLATILAVYHSSTSVLGTKMIIPFLNNQYLDLGIFYIPFIVFVIVATVNSVNLTDGLDGLASGITLIVLSFFGIIAFKWGMGSISIFSMVLAGACLGFLIHNAHPAKVFMGDTGSLGLGGAVASIALLLNVPLIIPIAGAIYLIETLSVIIQVGSFKITGKRVFLMSPLHHHYEEKGLKETTIVIAFWAITAVFCLIAYFSLI